MALIINLNIFSSEEEEEDEEMCHNIRRPYTLRERRDHLEMWDDEDFRCRFRFKKETVILILQKIEARLQVTWNVKRALSPMGQLLLTLRFYATGNMLRAVADFAGVSVATGSRIIKKVSLAVALLRPQYIKMPGNVTEIRKIQAGFYRMYNFPKVIGCIDGTHVKIQSPGGENAEIFRNRKGYFSLNTQVVCNDEMKIMDIVARWPGSAHDATIFTHSALYTRLEAGEFESGLILGDSAYPLKNYLLTPVLNPMMEAEENYNARHIRTRNIIERVFGVWKRRFPILSIGMRVQIETVQDIIVATAVLHNIAVEERDEPPDVLEAVENDVPNEIYPQQQQGNAVRNALIAQYFRR